MEEEKRAEKKKIEATSQVGSKLNKKKITKQLQLQQCRRRTSAQHVIPSTTFHQMKMKEVSTNWDTCCKFNNSKFAWKQLPQQKRGKLVKQQKINSSKNEVNENKVCYKLMYQPVLTNKGIKKGEIVKVRDM